MKVFIPTKLFHDALYNDPGIKGLDAEKHKMISPYIMAAYMGVGYGTYIVVAENDKRFLVIPSAFEYDLF